MKKLLVTITLACFGSFVLGQSIEGLQRTTIIKKTATWCPFCGQYGWDTFEGLISREGDNDNAILLAAHFSGDLTSPAAVGIANNFNTPGQPNFYLDGVDQNVTSNNWTSKVNSMSNAINTNAANQPLADVGMNLSLADGVITVDAKVKFLFDATGSYFVEAYVVEKTLRNNQSGRGNNVLHKNVLRAGMSEAFSGQTINSSNIAANDEFDLDFSIDIDSRWDENNLEVVVIIWKESGIRLDIVNANKSNAFNMSTNTQEFSKTLSNIKSYYADHDDAIHIEMQTNELIESLDIDVFDMNGTPIAQSINLTRVNGFHNWRIPVENAMSGAYLIRVATSQGDIVTKKLVVIK